MPDCPSVEHLSLAPCKSSPDEVQSKTTPVSFPSHNQNRLDSSGPPPPPVKAHLYPIFTGSRAGYA